MTRSSILSTAQNLKSSNLYQRSTAAAFTQSTCSLSCRLTILDMEKSSNYNVIHLAPKIPVPSHLIVNFKTLRLEAISLESAMFADDNEPNFTDEEWAKRMTSPTHHHLIFEFVGHQLSNRDKQVPGQSSGRGSDWVGMLTLLGPLSQKQYDFRGRQGPSLGSDEEETRWILFGLYLRSEHRGSEVNTVIHEAILDYVRVWTDEALRTEWDEETGMEKPKRARVRGSAESTDATLKGLYQALDAYEVGTVDMAEVLRSAGYDGLASVPDGEKESVILERVIEC